MLIAPPLSRPTLTFSAQSSPHSLDPPPVLRGIKRGYKNFATTRLCGVSIQDEPVWLWTLRLKEWSTIYISQPEYERLQVRYPTVWEKFKSALEVVDSPSEADPRCHQVSVWWVSGTWEFIESLRLPAQVGQVYWLRHQSRRWPKCRFPIDWKRITHAHVGGSTNARGVFGTRWLEPLDLPRELQRSLTHVIKFSIRPEPCPADLNAPHYTLHDRLSLNQTAKPVLYPTYMSRTGWGLRPLSHGELGACFDLPTTIDWDPSFVTSIVPLQLFRAVIEHVISRMDPASTQPPKLRKISALPEIKAKPDGVWLAGIKAWLPGSWAEVTISAKAVKSDDVVVDTRPWNQRIALVLPCRARMLAVLERLSMRRWRSNIILSFFGYLKNEYGANWWSRLVCPVATTAAALSGSKRPHGRAFLTSGATGGDGCFCVIGRSGNRP